MFVALIVNPQEKMKKFKTNAIYQDK